MKHKHEHCRHERLAYCSHCDRPYCLDCSKEWNVERIEYRWFYQNQWLGAIPAAPRVYESQTGISACNRFYRMQSYIFKPSVTVREGVHDRAAGNEVRSSKQTGV